jgi:hypothetical protein
MSAAPKLTQLKIFSRDGDFPERVLDIPVFSQPEFHSFGTDTELEFPGGHKLNVNVEVSLGGTSPDVLLSIEEGGRTIDVRCSSGVVVSYPASWNIDVLFQVGTGAWE